MPQIARRRASTRFTLFVGRQHNAGIGTRFSSITSARIVTKPQADSVLRNPQRDENTCRLDFTPEEAVLCGRAGGKLAGKGRPLNGKKIGSGNLPYPIPNTGETRTKVASAVGMKARTYDKAKSGSSEPENQAASLPLDSWSAPICVRAQHPYAAGSPVAPATLTKGACHNCSAGRPAHPAI